ncbi:MAG TPA: hypothetical protein VFG50_08020 [Rhodothermales bacterium]|nr:hypothetical protein [Rhodothermales bacterium]
MVEPKYVVWKEEDAWLGYLEEFPDYWTQGGTEEGLREHLADLYKELTSDTTPKVLRLESAAARYAATLTTRSV